MKIEDIEVTVHVDYLGMKDFALILEKQVVVGFHNQESMCCEFQKHIGNFVRVVKVGAVENGIC